MRTCAKGVLFIIVAVISLSSAGCANKSMRAMDVAVTLDQASIAPGGNLPFMDVDLIGVAPDNVKEWNEVKMNDYWQAGSTFRARYPVGERRYTMSFGQGQATQTLSKKDPIWAKWKQMGVKRLFVLANLPGRHDEKEGDSDQRHSWSLESYRWNGDKMDITISQSGPDLKTAMNPEKQ